MKKQKASNVSRGKKEAPKKRAKVVVAWRARAKAVRYFDENLWLVRRLVRVLKSSGSVEALDWAEKRKAVHILRALAKYGIEINHNICGGRGTKIGELAAACA